MFRRSCLRRRFGCVRRARRRHLAADQVGAASATLPASRDVGRRTARTGDQIRPERQRRVDWAHGRIGRVVALDLTGSRQGRRDVAVDQLGTARCAEPRVRRCGHLAVRALAHGPTPRRWAKPTGRPLPGLLCPAPNGLLPSTACSRRPTAGTTASFPTASRSRGPPCRDLTNRQHREPRDRPRGF